MSSGQKEGANVNCLAQIDAEKSCRTGEKTPMDSNYNSDDEDEFNGFFESLSSHINVSPVSSLRSLTSPENSHNETLERITKLN